MVFKFRDRKKKVVKKVAVLEDKPKVVYEKPEVVVETKPAEPRLICNYCGGELLLLRKVDNQTEYTCIKCHRGIAFC